jgi:hypothetical protein
MVTRAIDNPIRTVDNCFNTGIEAKSSALSTDNTDAGLVREATVGDLDRSDEFSRNYSVGFSPIHWVALLPACSSKRAEANADQEEMLSSSMDSSLFEHDTGDTVPPEDTLTHGSYQLPETYEIRGEDLYEILLQPHLENTPFTYEPNDSDKIENDDE